METRPFIACATTGDEKPALVVRDVCSPTNSACLQEQYDSVQSVVLENYALTHV